MVRIMAPGSLLQLVNKDIDKEEMESMEQSYWLKWLVPLDKGRLQSPNLYLDLKFSLPH